MKRPPRLWLIAGLALAALVAIGAVLNAISRLIWDLQTVLPYWLVGPVALLLFGGGALVIGRLAWPWLRDLQRRPQGPAGETPPLEPPGNRQEAAQQNLAAIDQLLERIRDDVQRQALQQERLRVEAQLQRGDLVLVVFGSGSVGKTSLIRALLRQVVGEVGAAMGSTRASSSYRLRLRGLSRGLVLVDTPGILEAGAAGQQREQLAREQAASADLLLLVVDGDLRAAEMEVFLALASLGKRLLLVLNKCDLRGEAEESQLLDLLRSRGAGHIAPEDVVPASAAPQSVPMPGGRPLQVEPEVEPLLRRVASVLHRDGDDLIADNILLQSRRLSDAGRRLLGQQRQRDAERIIDRYMWISAGVLVVTPLPVVDLLGTAAVNAQMVVEIGRIYGVSLSKATAQELALSVGRTLASLGVIQGGLGLIGTALSLNLPALLLGKAVQAVGAAWLTRIAGRSFTTYFEQDQDWGDGGLQEVVQRQYDLNRRDSALRQFLDLAIRRVVEPLQRAKDPQLPPQPGPRSARETAAGRDPGAGPGQGATPGSGSRRGAAAATDFGPVPGADSGGRPGPGPSVRPGPGPNPGRNPGPTPGSGGPPTRAPRPGSGPQRRP